MLNVDQPPAGPKNAIQFGQTLHRFGHSTKHKGRNDRVECPIAKRQFFGPTRHKGSIYPIRDWKSRRSVPDGYVEARIRDYRRPPIVTQVRTRSHTDLEDVSRGTRHKIGTYLTEDRELKGEHRDIKKQITSGHGIKIQTSLCFDTRMPEIATVHRSAPQTRPAARPAPFRGCGRFDLEHRHRHLYRMKYAVLSLKGDFRESGPASRFAALATGPFTAHDALRFRVERIIARSSVDRVLVKKAAGFSAGSPANLASIRKLITKLREAGKKTVFYAADYDLPDLYLASACDMRLVGPVGTVRPAGIFRSFLFFGKLIKQQKVEVDVYRHGKYKSAADALTRTDLDPANREQYEDLLGAIYESWLTKITEGYGVDRATVDELVSGGVLSAKEAREAGWISEIKTSDSLTAEWINGGAKRFKVRKIKPRYGHGPKVVVLNIEGMIADGTSRPGSLVGDIVGADSFVPVVNAVRRDKSVRGVILRVNSPGGSATASEDIRAALGRLAEAKPVVVSMAGVAASGGYWISTVGPIVADENTVTGSIGTIVARFNLRAMAERYGITEDSIGYGPLAGAFSPFTKSTKEYKRAFEKAADSVYDSFLRLVAESRSMDVDAVKDRAEGRVWTGTAAFSRGLVDKVGDFDGAVETIMEKLGVEGVKLVSMPRIRLSFFERMIRRNMPSSAVAYDFSADVALLHSAPLLVAPELLLSEAALTRLLGRFGRR